MEEERYHYWQNGHMEEAYRPPLVIALVFVLTMLAIYLMGRNVTARYPDLQGGGGVIAMVDVPPGI